MVERLILAPLIPTCERRFFLPPANGKSPLRHKLLAQYARRFLQTEAIRAGYGLNEAAKFLGVALGLEHFYSLICFSIRLRIFPRWRDARYSSSHQFSIRHPKPQPV